MDSFQERKKLYEIHEPIETGFIQVSNIHKIFYEVSGNKNGKPALIMHGGPGGSSQPFNRGFFDPTVYKIVQMDQRGSGKSEPRACLIDNTTWYIVDDMEKLRIHLNIEKWHTVFGGSWGSTISLAYAETHPERVGHLVLRGIFLARRSEIQYFYQLGSSWIFPEYHEELINMLPEVQRGDILQNYYRVLTGVDEEKKLQCAHKWTKWEIATSRLYLDPQLIEKRVEDEFALAFASIESYFFVNGAFLKQDDQLLADAHKLKNIPISIVQGRYDLVCPMKSAYDLHQKLPHADFHKIPDAGHSASEPGIVDALVRSTDKYKVNN